MVESLLVDLELTPAVVNVLLDYCLKKNNNKLTIAYVETIAGQWKRAGLETASEAMSFAEEEHKKTKQIKSVSKKSSEPEWFNKEIEKKSISKEEEEKMKKMMEKYN